MKPDDQDKRAHAGDVPTRDNRQALQPVTGITVDLRSHNRDID